jgi:uncharacterized protein YjiS (DUF1127 family)
MMVVSAGSHRSAHRTPRDLLRDAGRRLVGRRAGSELLKMNDHVLADLGLTRAAVLELVRRGRVAERRD